MAESIGTTLKTIRKKMGFQSARAFYQALEARADLQFNYSYYMKIEADQMAPSDKVINQLAALLPQADGDLVVAAYCHRLFPRQMPRIMSQPDGALVGSKSRKEGSIKGFQQELTERQVACVSRSQDHYFLFLLLTLARQPLRREQLTAYEFVDLDSALTALQQAKLVTVGPEGLTATFPEFVFPRATGDSLKKFYSQLDIYDQERHSFFRMSKVKRASFFKRISPRQSEIILGHLELLFQTIRSADDVDVAYNSEVISFNVNLHKGPLKG